MAVIQKTLFAKNLDRYAVLVNDTEPNSRYFKITELPDTFTGGKNAFLVAGSKQLVPDTKIQIELRDSIGNIIYHEPGEGYISSSLNGTPFVTEYYEGVSKVVSVYVYPDTSYGPCTLTILGELSEYQDENGITLPVPLDWENKYNVKWTKTINVNPALANTTKIRFYQRPVATITEIVSPIYRIVSGSKVDSGTNQSFADIKLSKLETFAGDVKRVKVFRTSDGDISDFDLIQDILVESKELLTSYDLSGSVVGNTGIFIDEVLKNYWNSGSLNTFLTSSRIESGVRLTGSGYFTYTSSLDIKSANTYELNLDAFYSASISTNLGIYLVSGSASSSIATLNGTAPTKNLLDTIIPFKIDRDFVSASLYFSQSQGEWHLGNISLKLSQDTAFSPDEITFVTTMPTVIGNETYNFKFEFYDVNNNYVPVAVTQSLNFTGGTNTSTTTLLISASLSQSLAALAAVSSSISGTVTFNSSSISTSVGILSGSVSGTIGSVSSSVSGTIGVLSGSVSGTIGVLSGSVSASIATTLSSSFAKVQQLANGGYPGTFIENDIIYSPVIGGQLGYFSTLFKVGTAPSIYLDARQNPRKIFIGGAIPSGQTEYSGAYNNTNTNVYLDSTGKFSLGNKLTFDGSNLSVNGSITITNPSTANNGGAVGSFSNGDAITGGSIAGVTIAPTKIHIGTGTWGNSNTSFYVDNAGQFSLKDKLTWNGNTLSITGDINISGGDAATKIANAALSGSNAQTTADLKITSGQVNANVTSISGGSITTGTVAANRIDVAGIITAGSIIVTGGAAGDVNSGVTKISGGQIVASSINATQISALNFTGKSASFDTGDIGGWSINSSNINKVGSTHTIKMDSANNAFTFTENSTSKLRMAITASTNIPDISITSQDTVTFTYTGTNRYSIATTGANTYNSGGDSNRILTATSGRGDGPVNLGYAGTGIIALTNPTEEIWVDTSEINADIFFMSVLNDVDTGDASSFTYQTYTLDLRVRKFADYTNANAETNVITTYTRRLAELTRLQSGNEPAPTDTINVNGASIEVTSAGNWFKVDLIQNMQTIVFEGGTSIMASSTFGEDFDGAITVRFGQIGNGYSILGPGGIQVYQGFRNYMKSAVASAAGANFFEVQGKSTFLSGLAVSGSFSATTKQFQITHPLNEKKWLYHTSVESPRADLIYRGILQLENGSGSVGIDSSSRMTIGTFDILTKERQLFLQNNDSFDRVMGKIESGSLYVISENTNATASINWLVTAERNDIELQKSNTYFDGKYKVEKYKSIYLKEIDDEIMSKFSGSI